MMKRFALALPFTLVTLIGQAQQRTLIGPRFGQYLRTADPSAMAHLFIEGSTDAVAHAVRAHGGTVKMKMRNWSSVAIPAGRVRELESEDAVRGIQGFGYGELMNDTMRAKTRIDDVQAGLAPLLHGYDGTGVVVGTVDTGMDFNHPDMKNTDGTTRVLHFWDHNRPVDVNTPAEYGYGQEWSKADIDGGGYPYLGTTGGGDSDAGGHGTTVACTAAGNGGISGHYIGGAPKADLVIVSARTSNNPFFASDVADGVKYIFDHATALGRPAVVNLSLGSYLGSHDGLDPAALLIDSMITAAPGRSVVCAAGNSGLLAPYHVRMEVDADTAFTWLRTNPTNSGFGGPHVYIDMWGDTAQMNGIRYGIGVDSLPGNGYRLRGQTAFHDMQDAVNTLLVDTLYSELGNRMAVCTTLATLRGGQYEFELLIVNPDSAAQRWRLMMTGDGVCDGWASRPLGLSELVSTVSGNPPPSEAVYPAMAHYTFPDRNSSIVDAWACSPNTITVGNYNNIQHYTAVNGAQVNLNDGAEGAISYTSSWGPARTGLVKPELAAPGSITFSALPLGMVSGFLGGPDIVKLGADSIHVRAGGTSIAAPAVTGAVALYMEQCPYATHAHIRQALIAAAVQDAFTQAGPPERWGAGKLDAWTPMTANVFSASATSNDLPFCPGDSSMATGEAGFADYIWSDGSTGINAWSQGEPLVLTVVNAVGCIATTDTLFFTLLPEPTTPVITQDGGVLSSTPADGWQWYLNGEEIPGANGQQYAPVQNGDYTVVITAPNGCTAGSEPYTYLSTGLSAAADPGFRLWPVPAEGVLFVTVDGSAPLTYGIIDAAGQVVKRGALRPGGTSLIDINGLSAGTYVLRTTDGERTGQRAFTVR